MSWKQKPEKLWSWVRALYLIIIWYESFTQNSVQMCDYIGVTWDTVINIIPRFVLYLFLQLRKLDNCMHMEVLIVYLWWVLLLQFSSWLVIKTISGHFFVYKGRCNLSFFKFLFSCEVSALCYSLSQLMHHSIWMWSFNIPHLPQPNEHLNLRKDLGLF